MKPIAILVACVVLVAAPGARAGVVDSELDAMLTNPPSAYFERKIRKTPILIRFTAQADVRTAVGSLTDKRERLKATVKALRKVATETQETAQPGGPNLLRQLKLAKVKKTKPLWIVNAVFGYGDPTTIRTVAARPDVETITYAGPYAPLPRRTGGLSAPPSIQPNIVRTGAPDLWDRGITGQTIVVGLVDSGTTVLPGITDNVVSDAFGVLFYDGVRARRTTPVDALGRGTHLLGVAVGQGGYGMAPGARWIACNAYARQIDPLTGTVVSAATDATIATCLQWMTNPDERVDENGDPDPDPAHLPDVVFSGISAGRSIGDAVQCGTQPLRREIEALRAAGILPVFPSGEDVDDGTLGIPRLGAFPETFSVGSADADGTMLARSYRGAALCTSPDTSCTACPVSRPAPNLIAPSQHVVGPWPGGGTMARCGPGDVDSTCGSDVAAAHVAGAAALVLSANPAVAQRPYVLDGVLERTAVPSPTAPVQPGELDAFAAATLDVATFLSQQTPYGPAGYILTDDVNRVGLQFRNDGAATWIRADHPDAATKGYYQLDDVSSGPRWGIDHVDPSAAEVIPGETIAFTFDTTAPHTPNRMPGHHFRWQLVHVLPDGTRVPVGQPSADVVVPVEGTDKAIFVDQYVEDVAPGGCGYAFLFFRNAGTNAWTGPPYFAWSVPGNVWGVGSLDVWDTFTEGRAIGWSFRICAPAAPGRYPFQWQMAHGFSPFGEMSPRVFPGADAATLYQWNPPPDLMSVGQSASVSVTLTNTGSSVWGPGYCVTCDNPGFWSCNASCLQGPVAVQPAQRVTFPPLTVTAPNAFGRYDLRLHAADATGEAFGPALTTTIGIPLDHRASREWSPNEQGHLGWFFRYFNPNRAGWAKMHSTGDHWKGAQASQVIHPAMEQPGSSGGVARFWKSGYAGKIRIVATAALANASCSDGVVFRVKHNRAKLHEQRVGPGGVPVSTFDRTLTVNVDDSLKFIVNPRSTASCDATNLDPLVQILPPDIVGAGSAAAAVANLEIEDD